MSTTSGTVENQNVPGEPASSALLNKVVGNGSNKSEQLSEKLDNISLNNSAVNSIAVVTDEVSVAELSASDTNPSVTRIEVVCTGPETSLVNRYEFADEESRKRWSHEFRMREVNYDFGYPILVSDENGYYVKVSGKAIVERPVSAPEITPEILYGIENNELKSLRNGPSSICGTGVFAEEVINPGEFIGVYMGKIHSDEEWEANNSASQFVFAINDGANGVILDGESGANRNALQFINHSCDPNAIMTEVFHRGCWHVAVVSKRTIEVGEEITHNYALVTEDEESSDAEIPCTCGAANCQGTLFRVVDW